MTESKVVVVGTVAFDTVASVGDLPDVDETVQIQEYERAQGGAGANVAVALSKFGLEPALLSTVGEDFVDSTYERNLKATTVNTEFLTVVDELTSHVFLFTSDNEHQQIYSHPGAVSKMSELKVPKPLAEQCEVAHFAAGNIGSYPDLMSSFDYVTFDPGQEIFQHDITDVWACFSEVDLLVVNEHEYRHFEEQSAGSVNNLLGPRGPLEALVITRGSDGCEVRTPNREYTVSAVEADVTDPSGAGDAHRAGMIAGLRHGLDLTQSLQLGATLAAFVVEQNGAQECIPSLDQIRSRFEAAWDYWPLED